MFKCLSVPSTFFMVVNVSGGWLHCFLEICITLVRLLAQCECKYSYKYKGSRGRVLEKLISHLSGDKSSFVRRIYTFENDVWGVG